MKKIFVLAISFALLSGCGKTVPTVKAEDGTEPPVAVADSESLPEPVTPDETSPEAEPAAAGTDASAAAPADSDIKLYDGYSFSYNGAQVYLGDEMLNVLSMLGPGTDFYESPSCAFDGMAKIYVYSGFEMATYITQEDGPDRLYSITFFDDSVATGEGVYIGQSYDDMVAAYGEDFEEIPGSYLYGKDGAVLSFTVEDEMITVIQYYIEDIYG